MSKNELLNKLSAQRTETLLYSRVMGYYSPRARYNDAKKQEAEDRVMFTAGASGMINCECSK